MPVSALPDAVPGSLEIQVVTSSKFYEFRGFVPNKTPLRFECLHMNNGRKEKVNIRVSACLVVQEEEEVKNLSDIEDGATPDLSQLP